MLLLLYKNTDKHRNGWFYTVHNILTDKKLNRCIK